jgi:hypothetical protein
VDAVLDERNELAESWSHPARWSELKAAALKSLADAQIALAKLARPGFSEDTAYAMAQAEWEDWSRYLRKHKWTLGDKRDEPNKQHEKLVDTWEATAADPELKAAALKSLAGTLIELMKLGYRSTADVADIRACRNRDRETSSHAVELVHRVR